MTKLHTWPWSSSTKELQTQLLKTARGSPLTAPSRSYHDRGKSSTYDQHKCSTSSLTTMATPCCSSPSSWHQEDSLYTRRCWTSSRASTPTSNRCKSWLTTKQQCAPPWSQDFHRQDCTAVDFTSQRQSMLKWKTSFNSALSFDPEATKHRRHSLTSSGSTWPCHCYVKKTWKDKSSESERRSEPSQLSIAHPKLSEASTNCTTI